MAATRASDADRDLCLNEIESAFADGRIDNSERETRTQAALQAKTLAELAQLTSDLRPPGAERLTSALSTASVPPGLLKKVLIAAIIPAVASVVIWIAASSGNDSPTGSADGTNPNLGNQPGKTLKLHTAVGFETFVKATRSAFGTTTVESAAIYPDYASVNIVNRDNPRRTERWSFREGYDGDPSKGTRRGEEIVVDLTAIDVPSLMAAVKRAPDDLNVKDATSVYIVVDDRDGQPAVSVYASNEYSESGHMSFTPEGKELYRYPFK